MKSLLLSFMVILVFLGCSGETKKKSQYNYIKAAEAAQLIREDSSKILIVDIQDTESFKKEHLNGAVSTHAYPVKTDAEKNRLAQLIPEMDSDKKIIIVCPRGAGGAERAYDYYLEKGIKKENLYTLENGQDGWPRDEISDVLKTNE